MSAMSESLPANPDDPSLLGVRIQENGLVLRIDLANGATPGREVLETQLYGCREYSSLQATLTACAGQSIFTETVRQADETLLFRIWLNYSQDPLEATCARISEQASAYSEADLRKRSAILVDRCKNFLAAAIAAERRLNMLKQGLLQFLEQETAKASRKTEFRHVKEGMRNDCSFLIGRIRYLVLQDQDAHKAKTRGPADEG